VGEFLGEHLQGLVWRIDTLKIAAVIIKMEKWRVIVSEIWIGLGLNGL